MSLLRVPIVLVRRVANTPISRAITRTNMHVRWATTATPVSRKRLKQMRDEDELPRHGTNFKATVKEFLDAIEKAVEPMKAKNSTFVVTRTDRELSIDLGPDKGVYTFATDDEMNTITLMSPMSGAQQYRLDTESKQWISIVDDHDVRGLFTRDLIRQCIGYPEFP